MRESTRQFIRTLEVKERKYSFEEKPGSETDTVIVRFSGDNMDTISVIFIFSDDCEDAAVRVYNIVKSIPESKMEKMLLAVNEQNNHYRFAKFCIDMNDSSLQMEMDAAFRSNVIGEICYELLIRSVNICDEAYVEFMKAMWS